MSTVPVEEKQKNVLDYKPILEPRKKINTNAYDYEVLDFRPSTSVQQIISVSPSETSKRLSNIFYTSKQILGTIENKIKDSGSDIVGFKNFKEALENKDAEIIDNFLSKNSNDITGNTLVEVYHDVYNLNESNNKFKELFDKINYGDVTKVNPSNVDKALFDELVFYEQNGDISKINYASLAIDTQINQVCKTYSELNEEYLKEINKVFIDEDSKKTESPSLKNIVLQSFTNCCRENNIARKKLNNMETSNIVSKGLYHSYEQRNKFLSMIGSRDEVNNIESTYVKQQLLDTIDNSIVTSFDSIIDFNKSIILNADYRTDYFNSLSLKNNLRQMYT